MDNKLKIVFAGTPEIAGTILAKMLECGYQPQLVLTQPDRPAGRGMKLTPSPVKLLAIQHGIEVYQPSSFKKEPEALQKIQELKPDLMVVVAYGLILPQALLNIPVRGCINIHVSLLPRWRGAAPIQRALLAGDPETGVCLMQMDAGLDTGDILMTGKIGITSTDTSSDLHDRLAVLGGEMLVKFLENPDNYKAVRQTEEGVSYAHKLEKTEAKIDWIEPASTIERKIRGYNPVPGAYTFLDGVLHKIWQASVLLNQTTMAKAGTIITANGDNLHIACGDGEILSILEIQEAGTKRKAVKQYLQAKNSLSGKRFGENEQ